MFWIVELIFAILLFVPALGIPLYLVFSEGGAGVITFLATIGTIGWICAALMTIFLVLGVIFNWVASPKEDFPIAVGLVVVIFGIPLLFPQNSSELAGTIYRVFFGIPIWIGLFGVFQLVALDLLKPSE